MPPFSEIQRVLCEWAKARSFIRRVWLFGSYLRQADFRGPEHPKPSDLDIAFHLGRVHPHSTHESAWICLKPNWAEEISRLLRCPVHLSCYNRLVPASHPKAYRVRQALEVASILLYDSFIGSVSIAGHKEASNGEEHTIREPTVVHEHQYLHRFQED